MGIPKEVQLRVENLSMAFGGIQALMNVSLEVKKGEIFSIIGPNGAGKTVLLNCINGLYHRRKAELNLKKKTSLDQDLTRGQGWEFQGRSKNLSSLKERPCSIISGSVAISISNQG